MLSDKFTVGLVVRVQQSRVPWALLEDSPALALLLGPTALKPCPMDTWETEVEAVEGLLLVGRPAEEEWAVDMLGLSRAIWLELRLSATPISAEMEPGEALRRRVALFADMGRPPAAMGNTASGCGRTSGIGGSLNIRTPSFKSSDSPRQSPVPCRFSYSTYRRPEFTALPASLAESRNICLTRSGTPEKIIPDPAGYSTNTLSSNSGVELASKARTRPIRLWSFLKRTLKGTQLLRATRTSRTALGRFGQPSTLLREISFSSVITSLFLHTAGSMPTRVEVLGPTPRDTACLLPASPIMGPAETAIGVAPALEPDNGVKSP
ncbi:hypothetical protein INR49_011425 [Caranx melampygus]|nr:hypothetical protein INR49_011425 [Caranx melampygus]